MFAAGSRGGPPEILSGYHRRHEVLADIVDARNLRHIHWLKWLAYYMIRRVERFGAQPLLFVEFVSVCL
jgi:hypothetical protein